MGAGGELGAGAGSALQALAVIPARLGSTRLERKMLLARTGLELFAHTALNVARCAAIEKVVVATDAEEIAAAAARRGLEAVLTSPAHQSGTDRVHEALTRVPAPRGGWDVVLNVQGDEPDLAPQDLGRLVALFREPEVQLATLWIRIESEEEARDPGVVKVVCDPRGDALYFSRSAIPSRTHARAGDPGPGFLRRHVGVYAFRPAALARFCALGPSALESCESLEQLRWLEAGGRIRTLEVAHAPRGVDTAEDYERFVGRTRAAGGRAE